MVDLIGQYSKIKNEIDRNIISSIESGNFVNGPIVKNFSLNLSKYLNVKNVIPSNSRVFPLKFCLLYTSPSPRDQRGYGNTG